MSAADSSELQAHSLHHLRSLIKDGTIPVESRQERLHSWLRDQKGRVPAAVHNDVDEAMPTNLTTYRYASSEPESQARPRRDKHTPRKRSAPFLRTPSLAPSSGAARRFLNQYLNSKPLPPLPPSPPNQGTNTSRDASTSGPPKVDDRDSQTYAEEIMTSLEELVHEIELWQIAGASDPKNLSRSEQLLFPESPLPPWEAEGVQFEAILSDATKQPTPESQDKTPVPPVPPLPKQFQAYNLKHRQTASEPLVPVESIIRPPNPSPPSPVEPTPREPPAAAAREIVLDRLIIPTASAPASLSRSSSRNLAQTAILRVPPSSASSSTPTPTSSTGRRTPILARLPIFSPPNAVAASTPLRSITNLPPAQRAGRSLPSTFGPVAPTYPPSSRVATGHVMFPSISTSVKSSKGQSYSPSPSSASVLDARITSPAHGRVNSSASSASFSSAVDGNSFMAASTSHTPNTSISSMLRDASLPSAGATSHKSAGKPSPVTSSRSMGSPAQQTPPVTRLRTTSDASSFLKRFQNRKAHKKTHRESTAPNAPFCFPPTAVATMAMRGPPPSSFPARLGNLVSGHASDTALSAVQEDGESSISESTSGKAAKRRGFLGRFSRSSLDLPSSNRNSQASGSLENVGTASEAAAKLAALPPIPPLPAAKGTASGAASASGSRTVSFSSSKDASGITEMSAALAESDLEAFNLELARHAPASNAGTNSARSSMSSGKLKKLAPRAVLNVRAFRAGTDSDLAAFEAVRMWCESKGEVSTITRAESRLSVFGHGVLRLRVEFRDKTVYHKICATPSARDQVNIDGVGLVALSLTHYTGESTS